MSIDMHKPNYENIPGNLDVQDEQDIDLVGVTKENKAIKRQFVYKLLEYPNKYGDYLQPYNLKVFFNGFDFKPFDRIVLISTYSFIYAGKYMPFEALKKCIPILQGLEVETICQGGSWKSNIFHKLARYKSAFENMLKSSYKAVFVSKFHKDKIFKNFNVNPESVNTQIVYTGIDRNVFKHENSENSLLPLLSGNKVLISVSRIVEMKGYDEMLKVFEKVLLKRQNFIWIIIGEGDYFHQLKDKVARKGLKEKVLLLGSKSKESLAKYYSCADCFWLLSKYDETFGLVYAEAQSCGLPAIGYNKGGVKEAIINGKTGFLVSSPEECIDIFINERYKTIKQEDLQKFVKKFNPEEAAKTFLI